MAAVLASVAAGTLRVDAKDREHGRRIARQNTWDGRAAQMIAEIESDCKRQTGRAAVQRITREEIDRIVDQSEAMYNAGDREGAKALLNRLAALCPFNARVMNNLGVIYRHEGDIMAALGALRAAISRNRYDYSANYHTAELLKEIGHKDVSDALFKHIKELERRIEQTVEADEEYRQRRADIADWKSGSRA
jgi:tetratricopeptide (TPR) repeat protein